MMSLQMLIEFGDGFDYTGADFRSWCTDAGFESVEVLALGGSAGAVAEQDRQTLRNVETPAALFGCGPVRPSHLLCGLSQSPTRLLHSRCSPEGRNVPFVKLVSADAEVTLLISAALVDGPCSGGWGGG